jgi:hypothetical protein
MPAIINNTDTEFFIFLFFTWLPSTRLSLKFATKIQFYCFVLSSIFAAQKTIDMDSTAFRGMRPFAQLMFGFFTMVALGLAFILIGIIVGIPFFGVDALTKGLTEAGQQSPEGLNFLKYFQVIQSIGLFIIPPFVLAYLYHGQIGEYLHINQTADWPTNLLVIFCIAASIPLINFLGFINSLMEFPSFLSGLEQTLKSWEEAAKVITEKFLYVETIPALLFNIFMIAMLPALGEELLFRGVIQRIFTNWTRKPHVAIWITAFLFSAIHFQFYGFLPRMALGAVFGYLLLWSGSLWVPILAHFVNNGLGVIAYYLINKGTISNEIEQWGTESGQFFWVVLSTITTGALLFLISRNGLQHRKMPANQNDLQAPRID